MRADKSVFLMGEEVAQYQGAYKVSQGLLERFSADEVKAVRTVIIPVNITYYPIRARENIFLRAAKRMEPDLSERALADFMTVDLSVDEAFGPHDPSLQRTIPKGEFPAGVKVGGQLRGTNDQGLPQIYNVVKIKGPVVLLDGNHPLAGIALRLALKVHGVREATEEEIGRGTAGTGFFRIQPQAPGNDLLH